MASMQSQDGDQTVREQHLQAWLAQCLNTKDFAFRAIHHDASFRRYFRVQSHAHRYVVMDAPPEKERCDTFVKIAKTFRRVGLQVPEIIDADMQQGFLLLTDFGDRLLLGELHDDTVDTFYQQAFGNLLVLQQCRAIDDYALPEFDTALYEYELNLFREWYLQKYLGVELSAALDQELEHAFQLLIKDALAQPKVCVHRDYHSRNLLVLNNGLGILDFQDAVLGPITYDLVSLLRDCYIDWPYERVQAWVLQYHQQLVANKLDQGVESEQFLRWFDWIGLQRNLKCIGIFSRLHLRDGKSRYLDDIPRVINYAKLVANKYSELEVLNKFLRRLS